MTGSVDHEKFACKNTVSDACDDRFSENYSDRINVVYEQATLFD